MRNVGTVIRERRELLGFSILDLSKACYDQNGIYVWNETIESIEKGEETKPLRSQFLSILDVLGLNIYDFFEE